MKYLIEGNTSVELQNAIDTINEINFQENAEIIDNEVFIISINDMTNKFPKRYKDIVNDTYGLTQSFKRNGNNIYLIIINEKMCKKNNANLIAVILHELGHIVNDFNRLLTYLEGITQNLTEQEILNRNQEIKLENEYHADYFTKIYGYGNEQIENLRLSLNNGFDDNELQSRITELESENIRITNKLRGHKL